jgi:hypothetical protein
MLVIGGVAAGRAFIRPTSAKIDTRVETGRQLLLVVFAPTSLPDSDFGAEVRGAVPRLRELAAERGYRLSTIGVSDDWRIASGLEKLSRLGPFDEVIVGRNWLNSGVELYVNGPGAEPAVPQVVVVLRDVDVSVLPIKYGPTIEIARYVGRSPIAEWARQKYALRFPDQ